MARVSDGKAEELARCAAVFEAADPPREATLAFYDPLADRLPDVGDPGDLTVALARGGSVAKHTVPAVRMPVRAAMPVLTRARSDPQAHPAAAFWGAAGLLALHLVARGRLLPGVSAAGFDAWRIGPLDTEDADRIGRLAAAMPVEARAVPVPDVSEPTLPAAAGLVRGFIDAVADQMPRTAAAARAAGGPAFAGVERGARARATGMGGRARGRTGLRRADLVAPGGCGR